MSDKKKPIAVLCWSKEETHNYKGAVALAVRPLMTAFRGAEYKVLRRKK